MIPGLVPEISPCDGFCDGVVVVGGGGIGYSSRLISVGKLLIFVGKLKIFRGVGS